MVLNNTIFYTCRQAFAMTNNMALSGLWKMLYLTIFMLTTNGIIGCAERDTWYQMVWHLIVDARPHTYPTL